MSRFDLTDVNEWRPDLSCTIVALCAISGQTPEEVLALLDEAGGGSGEGVIEFRPDYNINDWLKVIVLLGGKWEQVQSFADLNFRDRPSVDDWMLNYSAPQLTLVFCDTDGEPAHVFATIGGQIVDTYTGGMRRMYSTVPGDMKGLRVKRVFHVSDKAHD